MDGLPERQSGDSLENSLMGFFGSMVLGGATADLLGGKGSALGQLVMADTVLRATSKLNQGGHNPGF